MKAPDTARWIPAADCRHIRPLHVPLLRQMPITSPLPHELHVTIAEYAAADAILDTDWHWVAELCLLSQVFLPALAPILYHTVIVRASSLNGLCDHAKNPHSWFNLHTRHLVVDTETLGTNSPGGTLSHLIRDSPYVETITGTGSGLIWVQKTQAEIARAIHFDVQIELVGEQPPLMLRDTLLRRIGASSRLTYLHLSISTALLNNRGWTSFTPDDCCVTHLLLDIDLIGASTTPILQFITEWLRHCLLERFLIRPSHKLMSRAVLSRAFSGEGRPVRFQALADDLVLECKSKKEGRVWVEGHPHYNLDVVRSKMCDVVAGLELWHHGRPLYRSVDDSLSPGI